jgi:hypothetical protein
MWGTKKKQYRYYLGIDCGVHTGLCAWDRLEKKVIEIRTVKIHKAIAIVTEWHSLFPGEILVRVEDARLRKWVEWQEDEKAERGRREGAGSVKRDAVIWEDFLSDIGIDFEMVAPKHNKTKVSADYFKKLTGYNGITSKHARDAGMLIVGY